MSEPEEHDYDGEDQYAQMELAKAMEAGEFPKDGQYFDIKTDEQRGTSSN